MAVIPSNALVMWASSDVTLPNLAGANKVKPIDDLILKGWDFQQKPAADEFNYVLNNYAQWIEYLADYVDEIVISGATGDAASAGMISYFARNSAPVGYLKANGAAVNATTYANLATAIYVGDTLNPTALFGYKCTDPLNPTTTRSISGNYIVIPDLRGEFIRGWDDLRGVDSGRVFGSAQKGTLVGGYDDNNAGQEIGFLPNKSIRDYGGDSITNPSEYGITEVIWAGASAKTSYSIAMANHSVHNYKTPQYSFTCVYKILGTLIMKAYNYDPITKELLSIEEADKSPLEPDVYLFPANSTTVAAPTELEEHKTPCFNTETKQWSIVDDYREVKLYSKETKEIVFAALGQTPEALNATILQPTSAYDTWDELTQAWVYDSGLETTEAKSVVDTKVKALTQESTTKIRILNDAYELGIATEKEKTKLTEWKTYRVLLSRVSEQETYPLNVEYPSAPE